MFKMIIDFLDHFGFLSDTPQGLEDVNRKRFHRRPFLFRKQTVIWISALLAEGAWFWSESESLMITEEEKLPLNGNRSFPEPDLRPPLFRVVSIEVRMLRFPTQKQCAFIFPYDILRLLYSNRGRRATPICIVMFTPIAAFKTHPLGNHDLGGLYKINALYTITLA